MTLRITEILAQKTHGKSYGAQKFSYDNAGAPEEEADKSENRSFSGLGETQKDSSTIDLHDKMKRLRGSNPLVNLFLDGSRHVFKIDDFAYGNRIYPILAGQIAVACCQLQNKRLHCRSIEHKLVVVIPNMAFASYGGEEDKLRELCDFFNKTSGLQRLGYSISDILMYSPKSDINYKKLQNLAIAKVQDLMIETEQKTVFKLVEEKIVGNDHYLLKDGSLEYNTRYGSSSRDENAIRNVYQHVIGVSKSFNPEGCGTGKDKVRGVEIADLPLFHRTPVAHYYNTQQNENVHFGVWYLRVRDRRHTNGPLDGVVKVEKIMTEEEKKKGMDSNSVNNLCAHILNLRTPTCYGVDRRWANHLYPVYLTERYAKSRYLSSSVFLQLF